MSTKKLVTLSLVPLAKKEKPESEKFSHDQVGYENPSTHPHEECEDCVHFIPETDKNPAGCEGVQRPIAEGAWCHRFKRDNNMKKHKFHKTTVEHHKDGSHTIEHHHEDGDHKNVKSAVGSHDEMMDHMMDHTSAMNHGEDKNADNEAMEEKISPGIHSAVAAQGA